jgi:hypothetical protein
MLKIFLKIIMHLEKLLQLVSKCLVIVQLQNFILYKYKFLF